MAGWKLLVELLKSDQLLLFMALLGVSQDVFSSTSLLNHPSSGSGFGELDCSRMWFCCLEAMIELLTPCFSFQEVVVDGCSVSRDDVCGSSGLLLPNSGAACMVERR